MVKSRSQAIEGPPAPRCRQAGVTLRQPIPEHQSGPRGRPPMEPIQQPPRHLSLDVLEHIAEVATIDPGVVVAAVLAGLVRVKPLLQ